MIFFSKTRLKELYILIYLPSALFLLCYIHRFSLIFKYERQKDIENRGLISIQDPAHEKLSFPGH
jgi:hypothetical protein